VSQHKKSPPKHRRQAESKADKQAWLELVGNDVLPRNHGARDEEFSCKAAGVRSSVSLFEALHMSLVLKDYALSHVATNTWCVFGQRTPRAINFYDQTRLMTASWDLLMSPSYLHSSSYLQAMAEWHTEYLWKMSTVVEPHVIPTSESLAAFIGSDSAMVRMRRDPRHILTRDGSCSCNGSVNSTY
jgi:hypothetical protein